MFAKLNELIENSENFDDAFAHFNSLKCNILLFSKNETAKKILEHIKKFFDSYASNLQEKTLEGKISEFKNQTEAINELTNLNEKLSKIANVFEICDFSSQLAALKNQSDEIDRQINSIVAEECEKLLTKFTSTLINPKNLLSLIFSRSQSTLVEINPHSIVAEFVDQTSKLLSFAKMRGLENQERISLLISLYENVIKGRAAFNRLRNVTTRLNFAIGELDSLTWQKLRVGEQYKKFVAAFDEKTNSRNQMFFETIEELQNFSDKVEVNFKNFDRETKNIEDSCVLIRKLLRQLQSSFYFENRQFWQEKLLDLSELNRAGFSDLFAEKLTSTLLRQINSFFQRALKSGSASLAVVVQERGFQPESDEEKMFGSVYAQVFEAFEFLKKDVLIFDKKNREKITGAFLSHKEKLRQQFSENLHELKIYMNSEQFELFQKSKEILFETINEFDELSENVTNKQNQNDPPIYNGSLGCKKSLIKLREKLMFFRSFQTEQQVGPFLVDFSKAILHLKNASYDLTEDVVYQMTQTVTSVWKSVENFANKFKRELVLFSVGDSSEVSAFAFDVLQSKIELVKKTVEQLLSDEEFILMTIEDAEPFDEERQTHWNEFAKLYEECKYDVDNLKEQMVERIQGKLDSLAPSLLAIEEALKSALKCVGEKSASAKFCSQIKVLSKEWRIFSAENKVLMENMSAFSHQFKKHLDTFEVVRKFFEESVGDWKIYLELYNETDAFLSQKWTRICFDLPKLTKTFAKFKALENVDAIVLKQIANEIHNVEKFLPSLSLITGEHFEQEDWEVLEKILKLQNPIPSLIGWDLINNPKLSTENHKLEHLRAKSYNEKLIKRALQEVERFKQTTEFRFKELRRGEADSTSKDSVVSNFDELFDKANEKLTLLQSIKSSAFVQPFIIEVTQIGDELISLDEQLQLIKSVQSRWLQLYPIMTSNVLLMTKNDKIISLLPFNGKFSSFMEKLTENPNITVLLQIPESKEFLTEALNAFEVIKKEMFNFLETKRKKFTRLFFLGDSDLVDLLGNSQSTTTINKIISKIFPAIKTLVFSSESKKITGFKSELDEEVKLKNQVSLTESCEQWLSSLLDFITQTLIAELDSILKTSQFSLKALPNDPEQLIIVTHWILFFNLLATESSLENMEQIILQNLEAANRMHGLSASQEHAKGSLILDSIAQRDIVQKLIAENNRNCFYDFSLLKYNYSPLDDNLSEPKQQRLFISLGQLKTSYGFEYLGNQPKLVQTPLTEKCCFTMAQAMALGLGGNPYGPAGTGKTETVKALGGQLGRLVVVFNCDESMEMTSIGRLFAGVAGAGAWGCFDEFNRLAIRELSAVSQIVLELQRALKHSRKGEAEELSEICMLGTTIPFVNTAGVFITLNPASKGYRGRNKLPENLKVLFRSFAMVHPNAQIIARATLVTAGFDVLFSDKAAKTLVKTFDTAANILNTEKTYDWGLRALKAIILQAKDFCKKFDYLSKNAKSINSIHTQEFDKENTNSKNTANNLKEEKLNSCETSKDFELSLQLKALKMAIECNILAKLQKSDKEIFQSIFKVNFDPIEKELRNKNIDKIIKESEGHFESCCKKAFNSLDLSFNTYQYESLVKIRQLLNQRVGFAITGASGCGKTTLLSLLKQALEHSKVKVNTSRIFPKSMSKIELFGAFEENGIEFTEGVFVKVLRKGLEELANAECNNFWIVLEGDVDPQWVENFNSALDDNRLFTLPTGERFVLPQTLNIILETENLRFASLATISRLGLFNLELDKTDADNYAKRFYDKVIKNGQVSQEVFGKSKFQAVLNATEKEHLNPVCFVGNLIAPKITLLISTSSEHEKNRTEENNQFFCNKMTTASDFVKFVEVVYSKKGDILTPFGDKLAYIQINDLDLLRPDEFDTKSLEQLLIQIVDENCFVSNGSQIKFHGAKFVIVLSSASALSRISKKLLNRSFIESLLNVETDQYKNNNSSAVVLYDVSDSIFQLNNEMLEKNISMSSFEQKLNYLSVSCDFVKQKELFKLPNNFFEETKASFEAVFRPLEKTSFALLKQSSYFSIRLSKILTALENNWIANILLVGEPGTFRRTCVELAAAFLQIKLVRISSVDSFNKEVSQIVQNLLDDKRTLLMIEEHQLEDDVFTAKLDALSNFSNFLPFRDSIRSTTGLKEDELEQNLNNITAKFQIMVIWNKDSKTKFETMQNGFSCFQRKFHSILDCVWSQETTFDCANALINSDNCEVRENFVKFIEQEECRFKIRPFASIFNTIKSIKTEEFQTVREKYLSGVQKLNSTEEETKVLQCAVEDEKQVLYAKQTILDKKVEELTVASSAVDEQTKIASGLEHELKKEKVILVDKKAVIEEELEKVQPLVDEAKKQVQNLSKSNLDELRNYKIPPEQVVDIFEALLKLMNEFDVSWNNMKRLLGKRTFIENIIEINPRDVKPAVLKELENLMIKKRDSFEKDKIARVSVAAAPIAAFVTAMVKYVRTVNEIKPIEDEFNRLDSGLKQSAQRLLEVESKIGQLSEKQDLLKANLKTSEVEIDKLNSDIQGKEDALNRVQELLKNLASENERWKISLEKTIEKISIIDVLCLSASFYAVFLSQESPQVAANKFVSLCVTLKLPTDFSLSEFLFSSEAKIELTEKGHPDSSHYLINSFFKKFVSWPKMILDPDSKMLPHLQTTTANIETISAHDPKLFYKLELALSFGKKLLLTDVSFPLNGTVSEYLFKRTSLSHGSSVLNFGERALIVHANFDATLLMKNSQNEHEFADKIHTFNYSSSLETVQEEILTQILHWQRPDLEKKIISLTKKKQDLEKQILMLENNLLELLNGTEGKILEDEKLFEGLQETKAKSIEASHTLVELQEVLESVMAEKKFYTPLSTKISLLFETIGEMKKIRKIYTFTNAFLLAKLSDFIGDYKSKFDNSEFLKSFCEKICKEISATFQSEHFLSFMIQITNVLGLFDKPGKEPKTFANIFSTEDSKDSLFQALFLNKNKPFKNKKNLSNSNPLISEKHAQLIRKLEKSSPELANKLLNARSKSEIESITNNEPAFEQLLLSKIFAPQQLPHFIKNYLSEKFSADCAQKTVDLSSIIQTTCPEQPLLLLCPPGYDCSAEIDKLAKTSKAELLHVSAGQAESRNLLATLKRRIAQPVWLFFKNLHLEPESQQVFSSVLEQNAKFFNRGFKLIVSSEPADELLDEKFLQQCRRVLVERESSLTQSFAHAEEILANKGHENEMLSSLAYLHSIVVERARFAPVGWTNDYQFSSFDLICASEAIKDLLATQPPENIRQIVYNFVYLAKIDNKYDKKILKILFDKFFASSFDASKMLKKQQEDKEQHSVLQLDPSALVTIQTRNSKAIEDSLETLNANSTNSHSHLNSRSQTSNNIFARLVQFWKDTEKSISVISNAKTDNDLLRYFLEAEVKTFGDLRTTLQSLVRSAEDYLDRKIKLNEIRSWAELTSGETPLHFLEVWDNSPSLLQYLDAFANSAAILRRNVESASVGKACFDLKGVMNIRKLFEIVKLVSSGESKERAEVKGSDLRLVVSEAGKSSVAIKSVSFQGATLSARNLIQAAESGEKNQQFHEIGELNLSVVEKDQIAKERFMKVPVYLDAGRTTFLAELFVGVDPQLKNEFRLKSIAAFVFNY